MGLIKTAVFQTSHCAQRNSAGQTPRRLFIVFQSFNFLPLFLCCDSPVSDKVSWAEFCKSLIIHDWYFLCAVLLNHHILFLGQTNPCIIHKQIGLHVRITLIEIKFPPRVVCYETRVHPPIFLLFVRKKIGKDDHISFYCQQFIKRLSWNHCLQKGEKYMQSNRV